MEITKMAPTIRTLVEITGADFVSIGIVKDSVAITLLPKRGYGEKRFKKLLKESKVLTDFFYNLGFKNGEVFSYSSFGLIRSRVYPRYRWSKFKRLMTKVKEHPCMIVLTFKGNHLIDSFNNYEFLPKLIGASVSLNGRPLRLNATTEFPWKALGCKGTVAYADNLNPVIIRKQVIQTVTSLSLPIAITVEEGPEVPAEELLGAVRKTLYKNLFKKDFLPLGVINFEEISNYIRTEKAIKFMNSFKNMDELANLLGFSIKIGTPRIHSESPEGVSYESEGFLKDALVMEGMTPISAALLPIDIPVTVEKYASEMSTSSIIEIAIAGNKPLPTQKTNSLIRVSIVEDINVQDIELPFLFSAGGPVKINGEEIRHPHPWLFIKKGEKSFLDLWIDLANNFSLLEGIIGCLFHFYETAVMEIFPGVIPENGHPRKFEFDNYKFAMDLLSLDQLQGDEVLFSEVIGKWLDDSCEGLSYDIRDYAQVICNHPKCEEEHNHPMKCVLSARKDLLKFLLEKTTPACPVSQLKDNYSLPIFWPEEVVVAQQAVVYVGV